MKTVTILRKWNNPKIEIQVSSDSIQVSMTLDDFVRALTDEVAEDLVSMIAKDSGNPTFLFTKAQLEKHMIDSIEGASAQKLFLQATDRIIEAVKGETTKVM